MKINLSRYTPSQPKEDLVTLEVSTITKITLENIFLGSYVIHVMKQDIMQIIVLINEIYQRGAAKEYIMVMLQRMMNHPRREPDMKVKIFQARMNMF